VKVFLGYGIVREIPGVCVQPREGYRGVIHLRANPAPHKLQANQRGIGPEGLAEETRCWNRFIMVLMMVVDDDLALKLAEV
jgi:hypothetical protein